MESFSYDPPEWTQQATHALQFRCPCCFMGAEQAQSVWINRRAPVLGADYNRRWQEFYHCQCGQSWWAWSSDRPASEISSSPEPPTA